MIINLICKITGNVITVDDKELILDRKNDKDRQKAIEVITKLLPKADDYTLKFFLEDLVDKLGETITSLNTKTK